LGGDVFFTTFVPTNDLCASTGLGNLYALYYKTGTAYRDPVIGTTPSGSDVLVNRSIALQGGLPSEMAFHINSRSGPNGPVTAIIQSNPGIYSQLALTPSLPIWSRILAWRDM
jgi:type IV pilus assembly protein PilY1